MDDTLHHLFRYKAWANDQLLTALARLGDSSSITALAIKALSHTYVVDRIFAAHIRREAHGYASANLSEMPTLEDLSTDLRRSDQEYVDYVSTLDLDQLAERIDFAFTDGRTRPRRRREGGLPLERSELRGPLRACLTMPRTVSGDNDPARSQARRDQDVS